MIRSFTLLFMSIISIISFVQHTNQPVVIGDIAGYNGVINTSEIDISKLTHINYAFVDIKDNQARLHNERTDTINFRQLKILHIKQLTFFLQQGFPLRSW